MTQILGFITDVVSAMHDDHQIDALLMGFSKVFIRLATGSLIKS